MITPTSWIIFHCLDTKLIKNPSTIFAAIELIVLFLSDDVNTVKTLQ